MHIDLSKNCLSGKASDAIAGLFRMKNNLSYLDLTECALSSKQISKLFSTLQQNSVPNVLEYLNLSYNKIDVSSVQTISTYLGSGRICRIKSLNISYSNIGTNGASCLASSLARNWTLTHLNLSDTAIGDIGAQSIASSLKAKQGIVVT